MIKSASVIEVKQWLDLGDAVLVDVRENNEWAQGYIGGATHIPLATVTTKSIPSFQGKKLVMQCRSGARSRTACGLLTKENPDIDVYNLEGGILAWQQAGYEIQGVPA
jgi:rhodanese-related sulfurtransferase